jgi:hypothetical protein
MNCVSPPPIADRDLLAYLDGETWEDVARHLAQCPHCRERAEELARWQQALMGRLYRHECPPALALGEYHLGLLPPNEAAAVKAHLAACPHCRREVAELDAYLDGLQPSLADHLVDRTVEQLRLVIARLLSPPGPALSPAYAGVRGEEQAPALYEAEEIQIAIEIEDDVDVPGRKVILGLVLGAESPGGEALLWQTGRPIAAAPLDELGNFVIPDIAAGSYDLIVTGPRVEVHIENLDVGVS